MACCYPPTHGQNANSGVDSGVDSVANSGKLDSGVDLGVDSGMDLRIWHRSGIGSQKWPKLLNCRQKTARAHSPSGRRRTPPPAYTILDSLLTTIRTL